MPVLSNCHHSPHLCQPSQLQFVDTCCHIELTPQATLLPQHNAEHAQYSLNHTVWHCGAMHATREPELMRKLTNPLHLPSLDQ